MWAKKLKIAFLLLTGIVAVLSTTLPHHHHANGMICLEIDLPGCDSSHSKAADEDPADCTGCSWFSYKLPVDVASLHQQYAFKLAPVKILLGIWAVLADWTDVDTPDESPFPDIYIERLHASVFLRILGLRAPPVA